MTRLVSLVAVLMACPAVMLALAHEGPAAEPATEVAEASGATVDPRLANAVEVLGHVPSGKRLLARAQRFWGLAHGADILQKLKWGGASKTDAVLTRHFNPRTGVESRDRQVTIYLRQSQSMGDLVLDIAHELVHATSRPAWDPYDPSLTPGRYIWAAIEGDGGEVKAVATECQVSFEVEMRFEAAHRQAERCKSYLSGAQEASLDLERIRKDFYRVGHWGRELTDKLGSEREMFPLLSRETPKLYSSTGNAPYPVALFQEFEEITQIACENSRKRLGADSERAPAALQKDAAAFIAKRCSRRVVSR